MISKLFHNSRYLLVLVWLIVLVGTEFNNYDEVVSSDGDYRFLVLIEVQLPSNDVYYLNGCLASLSWVLTLSSDLAKIPSGLLSNISVTVFAGLKAFNNSSEFRRPAVKIMTNIMGSDNNTKYPNLVLLRLNTPFPPDDHVRLVVFNVGMLNWESTVVGWAQHEHSNQILNQPMVVNSKMMSAAGCNRQKIWVEFPNQICSWALQPPSSQDSWRLLPGALLIDQDALTAMVQMHTSLEMTDSISIIVLVRLATYVPWVQYVVLDPVPSEVFLTTRFTDDNDRYLNPFLRPNYIGSTNKPRTTQRYNESINSTAVYSGSSQFIPNSCLMVLGMIHSYILFYNC